MGKSLVASSASMRLLIVYFVVAIFSLWSLVGRYIDGKTAVLGVYAGVIIGLFVGIFNVLAHGRSAQKDVFTIKPRKGVNAVIEYFFAPLVGTVFLVLILLVLNPYFGQHEWPDLWITFVMAAFLVCFSISGLGVVRLERRYRKKFYYSRRQK